MCGRSLNYERWFGQRSTVYLQLNNFLYLSYAFLILTYSQPTLTNGACWDGSAYQGSLAVRSVHCNKKGLMLLPGDLPTAVTLMDVSANGIKQLDWEILSRYPLLEELNLRDNHLVRLEPWIFSQLQYLKTVSLAQNRFSLPMSGFLDNSSSIEVLSLSGNPLHSLPAHFLLRFPALHTLDLSECRLQVISPDTFSAIHWAVDLTTNGIRGQGGLGRLGQKGLQELNIASNRLQQLPSETESFIFTPILRTIRLYDNFWVCDCRLRWLRKAIEESSALWSFGGGKFSPACEEPWKFKHVKWTGVGVEQFGCEPVAVGERRAGMLYSKGENLRLNCLIHSDPPTRRKDTEGGSSLLVDWYLDGVKLRTEDDGIAVSEQVNGTEVSSVLSVTGIGGARGGVYMCSANNGFGVANVTYSIRLRSATSLTELSTEGTIAAITIGATSVFLAALLGLFCYCRTRHHRETQFKPVVHSDMERDVYEMDSTMRVTSSAGSDGYTPSLPMSSEKTDQQQNVSNPAVGAGPNYHDTRRLYNEEYEQEESVQVIHVDDVERYPEDDAGCAEYNLYLSGDDDDGDEEMVSSTHPLIVPSTLSDEDIIPLTQPSHHSPLRHPHHIAPPHVNSQSPSYLLESHSPSYLPSYQQSDNAVGDPWEDPTQFSLTESESVLSNHHRPTPSYPANQHLQYSTSPNHSESQIDPRSSEPVMAAPQPLSSAQELQFSHPPPLHLPPAPISHPSPLPLIEEDESES